MTAPADAAARAAELREQVSHHGHRYYVLDDPEIGDDVYDALLDELQALEAEHPELVTPDSPTQRVGGEPVSALEKVPHLRPMLSLANARSEEELRAWVARMRSHLAREGIEDPRFRFVAEPKIDGLAISLIYRDGVLERGATRGNGEVGEDVTHNLRTIGAIPLRIEDAPPLLEVRGEVYMSLPDFAALNERRAEAGLSTFMNPRNSAAGTIRQLDPALAAERPLSMWCYAIGVTEGLQLDSHWDALEWLRAHGFRVNDDVKRLDTEDEVVAQCLAWQDRRGALDFEIDGVVVKVDDFELQRRLGVVGRDPRWAIAWKFPPTTAVTLLNDIQWNVGKFGDLHPFAVLEPVHVGGVTVKLATLHNEEDLARKDVRVGDDVIVLRAGDVIPQVLSPAPHAVERADRGPAPKPPARCPCCDTPTVKDGRLHALPEPLCPERHWQLLKAFARDHGHRRAGREAGAAVPGGRPGAHGGRLLPAHQGAAHGARRVGEMSAENLLRSIESSKARDVRARPVRARHRGRRLRHGPQPGRAVPHGRRAARRDGGADRRDAGDRAEAGRADPLATRRREAADADRRPARGRPAVRAGRPGARRGPAARPDVRAHRHAARPHARGGDRADHRGGRQGHRLGVQEDVIRRRRRVAGLQAREGGAARRAGARRGRPARTIGRDALGEYFPAHGELPGKLRPGEPR